MGQKASRALPIGTPEAEGVVGFKRGLDIENVWVQLFDEGSLILHKARDSASPVRLRMNISMMLYVLLDAEQVMIGKKGTLDAIILVFVEPNFRNGFLAAATTCGCYDFTSEHFKMIAANSNVRVIVDTVVAASTPTGAFCGGCGQQTGPNQTFCSKCGHDKRNDV